MNYFFDVLLWLCALPVVSYSIPIGQQTADGVHYKDTTYSGVISNDFYRKDGTGILTDRKYGPINAKELSGKGWVGWSSQLTQSQYITVTFEFSGVRTFKDVIITVNIDKKYGHAVFSKSRTFFASTKDGFSDTSYLQFCPTRFLDTDDQYNANVTLALCDNAAQFIKMQLYFGGKWLLITEIHFNSGTVVFYLSYIVKNHQYKRCHKEILMLAGFSGADT